MIAKMKSNLSSKDTLLYNDKEKSEIIFVNNLTGETWREVEKQMTARQKLFTGRAKNLTAHIMISPGIEDGKKLTRLDWKEIGNSFLQKANLSSYQSIAYLHKDKEHFHLHIVANRIDQNGKIYRNGNELVMSQRIGDEIAMERGLNRAAEVKRERKLARENGIVIKNDVGSVALMREVVTKAAINAWKGEKFEQEVFFSEIKTKGFEVRLFFKKDHENKSTDELRGYAIGRKNEHFINASQIGSEFTLRRLMQEVPISSHQPLSNNEEIKDSIRKDLKVCFDKLVRNEGRFDPHQFLNEVRLIGNPVKEYHHKDTGKLRGYAIIRDGVIFNSSEIGMGFTLANLQKRFNELTLSADPLRKVSEQKIREPKTHEKFHPDPGDQPLINNEQIKDSIRKDLQVCFDKLVRNEICFDSTQFLNEVRLKGNLVTEYHNKDTKKLRGYAIEKDGFIFNASEIGTEFTLANLQKRFNELVFEVNPTKKVSERKTWQPKTLHEELHPDPDDQISKELKRTIDLTLITSDLRNLTSGHKYQSHNDFIEAVEGQGYHVHLRYDKGSLAGYTVHKGTEHYHDKEIENGRFSIDQLTKNGMFIPRSVRNFEEVIEIRTQTSVDDSPIENKLTSSDKPINVANQLFIEQEARKEKESEKERIRKIIANELRTHLHSIYNGVQPLNVEKFFGRLVADGYVVTRHFNKETGSLRGYSLEKYGFDFPASDIGREFTLKSLGVTLMEDGNIRHKQGKPRIIL